ncbi:MAG TPA: DUF1499 domain-containing protein [Thermodesulfobacteriota bacterium]|nr:DUF1499 domain-containing protein [Thermodesulfobacteriota bacterium]
MSGIISLRIALMVVSVLFLTVLSCASNPPKVQLVDGRLRACPKSPNCVSSESDVASSRVEPLTFKGSPEKAWSDLKETIREMGGKIQEEHDGYLWVTFTSRWFRFVDDMEFKMVSSEGLIHVRSASRKGYSDLRVNRKRVEKIRILFYRKDDQELDPETNSEEAKRQR